MDTFKITNKLNELINKFNKSIKNEKDKMYIIKLINNYNEIQNESFDIINKYVYNIQNNINSLIQENCELLYNIQSLKGIFITFVNIVKPEIILNNNKCIDVYDNYNLSIYNSNTKTSQIFNFSRIFSEFNDNSDIFKELQYICMSVYDGENIILCNYGESDTKKSKIIFENDGLIKNILIKIFNISRVKKLSGKVEISVEALEIFNEEIYDLLSTKNSKIRFKYTEDSINFEDIMKLKIKSKADINKFIEIISKYRFNTDRVFINRLIHSHILIRINVLCLEDSNIKREGKICICDLPGSEILSKINQNKLSENITLNKSMYGFINLIKSFKDKRLSNQYQNSKLTLLLKDYIINNPRFYIIFSVLPSGINYENSIQTLKFAEYCKTIELNPIKNNISMINTKCENIELKRYIKTLETSRKQLSIQLKDYETNTPDIRRDEDQKTIQLLKIERDDYRVKYNCLLKDFQSLQSHIDSMEYDNNKLIQERKNSQITVSSLTKYCDDLKVEKNQLQNSLNKLKMDSDRLSKINNKLSLSIESTPTNLTPRDDTLSRLNGIKMSLNQSNRDYFDSIRQNKLLENQISELKHENEILNERLTISNQKLLSVNRKCNTLTYEIESLRQKLIQAKFKPEKIIYQKQRTYSQTYNFPAVNHNRTQSCLNSRKNTRNYTGRTLELSSEVITHSPLIDRTPVKQNTFTFTEINIDSDDDENIDKDKYAIIIQKIYRGYIARKNYKKEMSIIRKKVFSQRKKRDRAATDIQRCIRGWSTRKLLYDVLSSSPTDYDTDDDLDLLFD